jgi:nucleotide-binding universal stress UspA family protein
VLVVPATVRPCALAKVAVAWDGSREAVRAVHDALPLLRLSRSVQIVTVISPSAADSEANAEKLSTHLANHGISVGSNPVRIRSAEEHESLQQQIEQGDYDLLVMGVAHTRGGGNSFSGARHSWFFCRRKFRSLFRINRE